MQFVTETCKHAKWMVLALTISTATTGFSQTNSPYSRFGLGDLYNSRNVVAKGMGGLATAYTDYQSVNFINPASLSNLQTVTFDVALESEFRNLINQSKTERSQSGNISFNYVALGMPLLKDKKGLTKWGLALGIRPYTRIGYDVFEEKNITGIDSVRNFYTGSGGAYNAFVSTGYRVGNFSLGINAGFLFGQKDLTSRQTWVSDSIFYYNSLKQVNTGFTKFSVDGGFQYKQPLNKNLSLRLGANGHLGTTVKAEQDRLSQTYVTSLVNGFDSVDVVDKQTGIEGEILLPASYAVGLTLERQGKWLIGVEYDAIQWDDYRFFGQKDQVANSSTIRVGGNFIPGGSTPGTKKKGYLNQVVYRAGFYTGTDYVVANGIQLPIWGVSTGFGLPVRRFNAYSNQYTSVNLSFEYGSRGGNEAPVKESFFKVNAGLNLSDIWFIKRKYN